LAFQNRAEKNLLFIALTSTVLALTVYCDPFTITPGFSFIVYRLLALAWPILMSVSSILSLLIILRTFRRKITLFTKILMGILFICGAAELFFENSLIIAFQVFLIIVVYAYYIITSWKTLRGAQ